VSTIILLMLAYTYKGGIKTLVWTDTFQSAFLLLGLFLSIAAIARGLGWNGAETFNAIAHSEHSQVFFWNWHAPNFFWKHFIGGAFTAIVMTGLDQNMMQKNLSCRSLGAAKKNIYAFTGALVVVNLAFLSLGALLYAYTQHTGTAVPPQPDRLFPELALNHLGLFAAVVFMFGLTAATFSSADSVLTTLTTSFCIDFLGVQSETSVSEKDTTKLRHRVHVVFAVVLLLAILAIKALNSKAVIDLVLAMATYTYGPLLGLFAVGILSRWKPRDPAIPWVCLASPIVCYVLDQYSVRWFGGYRFGLELLVLNGAITAAGLWLIRERQIEAVASR
jgi:Na+/proline symporter